MLMEILDSNFAVFLATLIVGVVAYLIYRSQRCTEKKNAAIMILMEIRSADKTLNKIKETKQISGVSVLPINNWIKFSHLFVQDFDRDELDSIDNFYNNCSNIEDRLKGMNKLVDQELESKFTSIYSKILLLAEKYKENGKEINLKPNSDYIIERNKILETYFADPTTAMANAMTQRLLQYLNNVESIINTSVFQKLKRIAKFKR